MAGTRIVIAENQARLQQALRINLRARGYDLMAAHSGREALAMAASWPTDAVILDLGLPDLSGTGAIAEMRRW